MSNIIPIKMWQDHDKPREKMRRVGPKYLSNSELLALVINSGNKHESALDISRRLLAESKSGLYGLAKSDYEHFLQFSGIGKAKACQLLALFELCARIDKAEAEKKVSIQSSRMAYDVMKPLAKNLKIECFWVIFLDRANQVIKVKQMSEGGVFETSVDPVKIYKSAISDYTTGLILVHNHPSNRLHPSQHDIKLTQKLSEGAKLLSLTVLDHLIIGDNQYFSFKDQGLVFN